MQWNMTGAGISLLKQQLTTNWFTKFQHCHARLKFVNTHIFIIKKKLFPREGTGTILECPLTQIFVNIDNKVTSRLLLIVMDCIFSTGDA